MVKLTETLCKQVKTKLINACMDGLIELGFEYCKMIKLLEVLSCQI